MEPPGTPGEIITFYSYKGGTGRTMALSNVACLLAERYSEGSRVLMIDWDLEAPGLHKFFQDRFQSVLAGADDPVRALDEKPGLIDLFLKLDAAIPEAGASEEETERIAYDILASIKFEDFIIETDIPNLSLLKAGRFDEQYSNKVNKFNWEGLYNRSPSLIRFFAEELAKRYRYVLIDSRTGYTDISGICTMLMPQKLVVVFTPNRQSYTGIEKLVKRATNYRRQSDDLRPLLVLPLPSRIESSVPDLRRDWRFGNPNKGINGYQPMFEELFKKVYDLNVCKLGGYFDEVQIQQSPNYAYGEEIAVKAEQIEDSFSLTKSYKTFTEWLANSTPPWQPALEKINVLNITAQRLYEEGKYDQAVNKWKEVLKIDPKNQIALNGLEETKKIKSKIPVEKITLKINKYATIIALIAFIIVTFFNVIPSYNPFMSESPQLSVSPDPPSFNLGSISAGQTASRTFSILNAGGGNLTWSISYDQPWITVIPTSGINTGNITININTVGLSPGSYSGNITVISKETTSNGTRKGIISLTVTIPLPKLVQSGNESYVANGKQLVRYRLAIENWEAFPSELFESAPDLPPCGSNRNASRTWVDIYDAKDNRRIYGFCALSSPQDLTSIWFAVEAGMNPPQAVYVSLIDRKKDIIYSSNVVTLMQASPVQQAVQVTKNG